MVSAAFSFYVENFANYSVIYGTLGTVIVLMMWLNLSAVMLIMGAEVNGALLAMRNEKKRGRGRALPGGPAGEAAPAKETTL